MPLKRDPSKGLQLGFLALLGISIAQVGWWIYENIRYSADVRTQTAALYRAEAAAIETLLGGEGAEAVEATLPHLAVEGMQVTVRDGADTRLRDATRHRINLYAWEGGFFIAVLLGGMAVLTRTIRHDAELRRRQQNFLAAVSHEFKSPLASMRLAAETLVLRSADADTQRLGRRILEDDERLLRMVDNLLDTTRIEEGRATLAPERTDLRAAAETVAAGFAERADGIEISIDVPDDLALRVDGTALETILRNLIDNAVKACAANRGGRIEIAARRAAGDVALTVTDDGQGFAPDEAELMFEKFYRAGDELRRTTPGTGLGLYIVKRLAELSGARVAAASEGPGYGATLTLTWPESYAA